jgi:hypothetical protein
MSKQASSFDQNKPASPSELFTVRVWREALNDHYEWRGKVQHSGSGKSRYFRNWQTLVEFIQDVLPNTRISEGQDVQI